MFTCNLNIHFFRYKLEINRNFVLHRCEFSRKGVKKVGHREEILGFLNRIAPQGASNAEIVSHTQVRPHQQAFQITKKLMDEGLITGHRYGREWRFSVGQAQASRAEARPAREPTQTAKAGGKLSPPEFEGLCRRVMSKKFGTELRPASAKGVHKQFDLVSDDKTIIGDAKYYTAVNGTSLPPAKFATIAEYVWLLEKARTKKRFLVFGNDRRVPEWWLDRYGNLTKVAFYFLSDDGDLERLNPA